MIRTGFQHGVVHAVSIVPVPLQCRSFWSASFTEILVDAVGGGDLFTH